MSRMRTRGAQGRQRGPGEGKGNWGTEGLIGIFGNGA